jgi:mono/diheme cytochrome c family protein
MTRLLVAGCVAVLSVATVIGQASQTTRGSKPVSSPVARQQVAPQVPGPKLAAPVATEDATKSRALVDQYCVTCHNARLKTAGLLLDQLDLANLGEHAEIGEKVVRKIRAGLMPPTDARRPDAETMNWLVRWMENELDRGAETHLPAPGLHRLNRTEYSNAIRDLLALEVDASKFLPTDDSTHGFDNVAGALTMSPALMEAYLSAAGKISRLAIGDVDAATQWVWDVAPDTAQNYHIEGLPFGTRGGLRIEHQFPADGEYAFNVKGVTGYFQRVLGGITGEKLEILVDGERVHLFDWDKEISNTTGRGRWTPRIPITAGHHVVGVTFLATNDVPGTELNKPFQRTMNTPGSIPGFIFYPHVGQVTIEGPHNARGAKDTASRQRIFVCRPSTSSGRPEPAEGRPATPRQEDACARTIVSTLAKRAFRRPSTAADLKVLMPFYQAGRGEGGSFDDGIEAALQRVLADPEFIYRGEREPAALAAGRSYRLSDLELASRLSFFLWSSIPDDELIDVAASGKLKDPAVLDRQVKRMLADPRSADLITNFTGQWLSVRSLKTVEPVVNLFPDFDDNLRNAFQREVELFFESIVREDRSVLDLLDADYTFVNERLAKHYGIPNIYGPQFRRVTLPPELDMRRGLLGKGALLTVTSNPARTSPVARGKWVQATLLGVEPPQPPPGVEINITRANDNTGNTKQPTMRQVLEQHRISPTCAACHKIFEPVGLALENFDAVGAWRTQEEGLPVDTRGKLPDGTSLDAGVSALRGSLVRYSDQFARVVAEKLLTYALGRGVEYDDMPTVRTIVRGAEANKYRFSSLVAGIVKSEPFQMNMKPAAAPAGQRAER